MACLEKVRRASPASTSAKTGEEASVESKTGVSQKMASLKVDSLNQTLLLQHITEEGDAREIARMSENEKPLCIDP